METSCCSELRWDLDRPADDVVSFAARIGVTSAVMLGRDCLPSVGPARPALGINPIDAVRDG